MPQGYRRKSSLSPTRIAFFPWILLLPLIAPSQPFAGSNPLTLGDPSPQTQGLLPVFIYSRVNCHSCVASHVHTPARPVSSESLTNLHLLGVQTLTCLEPNISPPFRNLLCPPVFPSWISGSSLLPVVETKNLGALPAASLSHLISSPSENPVLSPLKMCLESFHAFQLPGRHIGPNSHYFSPDCCNSFSSLGSPMPTVSLWTE